MSITPSIPPRETIIRCERLRIGYRGETILSGVDLAVPRGAFLPFVGPNGAGKTTLLRALLGLHPIQSGRLATPFASKPPGYVSQQKSIDPLYPVSALDIVLMGFYPCMDRRGPSPFRSSALALMERMGLECHADKAFHQLSGGMRQKVLIARALAAKPDVLVMDEPTTELDDSSQTTVLDLLHRVCAEDGRTVLLAHHGLDALLERTEQVCLVRNGTARIVPLAEAHF